MLAGADVLAVELAAGFGLGLLAAVAGLVEERVVHVLRHQREDVLREAPVEPIVIAAKRDDRGRQKFLQGLPPLLMSAGSPAGGLLAVLAGVEHVAQQVGES